MPYTPELTKARIYDAAVAEFAERGLAGARVERIAQRAGANKQAIYLYFGDKQNLWATVLRQELGALARAVNFDPDDLPGYLGQLFDFQRGHPHYVRLLLWEALEFGGQDVPAEQDRSAYYRHRAAGFTGQPVLTDEAGGSLPPAHLYLALVGLANWYFAATQMTRMALGHLPDDADHEHYRALITRIAQRLQEPRGLGSVGEAGGRGSSSR